MRSTTFFFTLLSLLYTVLPVAGQECSAIKKCATGCCSKFGFCGTSKDHCGDGCLSTCDFKLGCDADRPCADETCCSKFGFCGFGKDFCSPENCVAGCHAKAQCDPGSFGADYVELKKCPLNVCCSKWGYCGATAEFCGEKKVDRPSCAARSDAPVNRVVGYYEGWAARRSCHAFQPEDVPMGVYTHLNFAFAGIDPLTYKIVPAQIEDVALYSRLTDLKKYDSSLKVFIAIGGWSFNDPGPTFHTFSELAADLAKQKVFFKSLISFLNTYNFDGVDIDWEYPTTPERGGQDADYANYPDFMKNLKAALNAGSGGRNGLTATLPVSFWYLQHFDIVELEKWVDFFNIMSYDLHGLWDKGNKWLGAYLNSHTNMTEITEYLDLFWRNEIKPEKITLGLAFYSRTFLAADPGCTHAQCMFDSVGEAGPCSRDDIGGTLTNAELTDQIRAAGVTPTLDKDAMVKIAVIGRKWITYDDEDTFRLKVDAARNMCLGGVMVWAVSQDYAGRSAKVASTVGRKKKRGQSGLYDTRFSLQLQAATRYKSLKAVTVHKDTELIDEPSPKVVRNQCYWASCGISCASGYTTVPRIDSDASRDEVMQDGYHCQGGTLRQFCCPASKTIPRCGWYDFRNGKCGKKGACPAGSESVIAPSSKQREVGSTKVACGNDRAQLACCQTAGDSGRALDSMIGYDICKWHGTASESCDDSSSLGPCSDDPERHFDTLSSFWGSGAATCRKHGYDQYRTLCCKRPVMDTQWIDCWGQPSADRSSKHCSGYCPDGKIRMAMEKPRPWEGCNSGANAVCCTPRFLTEANNVEEIHHGYVSALQNVLAHPENCKWDKVAGHEHNKRGIVDYSTDCKVALQGTMNMLGSPDSGVQQRYVNDWNFAVNSMGMYGIPASAMQTQPEGYAFSTAPSRAAQTDIAIGLINVAKKLDTEKKKPTKFVWKCPSQWNWDASLDIQEDPDDGGLEVIEPESQGIPIHHRRSFDPDSLLNASTKTMLATGERVAVVFDGQASSSDVPLNSSDYKASSDPDKDDSQSAPDCGVSKGSEDWGRIPTPEEWREGVKRLRKFRIKDTCSARSGPYDPKRRHRSDENCLDNYACRAKMLGYDVSKSEDSQAYYEVMLQEAKARPRKRYADILDQRNNKTLQERDWQQMGQPRKYTIPEHTYAAGDWPGEIIESSAYPNGNQGDDLMEINNDRSRYVVKSAGCGPQDYELKTRAAKNEVNGIWVTEHILELNTIGRFMAASLDGALPSLQFGIGAYRLSPVTMHEVQMFAHRFQSWDLHTAISPADSCLVQMGSKQNTRGLVVCDSTLNMLKTKIYKLENPVGETTWDNYAIFTVPESLERALAYIQGIMAVFDYYDDANVKSRHAQAYQFVMQELARFEESYRKQFVPIRVFGLNKSSKVFIAVGRKH
ncbi:uncharacterized protein UV8b_06035 [Ustilaginoidea virens]|uniref:chitinase n=1 Tax=Ustilaginoidea virens TaxID=1159556 RepID=A0A8E5HV46_USTVR|nr:uncharacterized protein UV8b_06035 [Ustilaginoidea virens]QUC21794.1 hypothetical protein UV8b_06035 [Ustilaginoidea virens]